MKKIFFGMMCLVFFTFSPAGAYEEVSKKLQIFPIVLAKEYQKEYLRDEAKVRIAFAVVGNESKASKERKHHFFRMYTSQLKKDGWEHDYDYQNQEMDGFVIIFLENHRPYNLYSVCLTVKEDDDRKIYRGKNEKAEHKAYGEKNIVAELNRVIWEEFEFENVFNKRIEKNRRKHKRKDYQKHHKEKENWVYWQEHGIYQVVNFNTLHQKIIHERIDEYIRLIR